MDPHLLQGVLDAPDDDAPRLILADWLEERNAEGDAARAEFIRVQLEVEDIRRQQEEFDKADISHFDYQRAVVDKRQKRLRRRERELLATRDAEKVWFAPVPSLVDKYTPRRGFVDSVSCAAANWLAHGPDVVRCQPVTEVRLADVDPVETTAGTPLGGRWFFNLRRVPGEFLPWLFGGRPIVEVFADPTWPTADAAHAALSSACLQWAKATAPPTTQTCAVG